MKTELNYLGQTLTIVYYYDEDDSLSGYMGEGLEVEEIYLFDKEVTELLEPQIENIKEALSSHFNDVKSAYYERNII